MLTYTVLGTVYLIHFERPYQHARHYIGWTEDLSARLQAHRDGCGSALMAAVTRAGIGWVVARTWEGEDRGFERRLHRRKNSRARLCPICGRTP